MTSITPTPIEDRAISSQRRRRAVAGTAIGNAFEWYDFSAYSYLTPVLAVVFFPTSNRTVGILLAFAVFAVGFIARPVGAILFGHIADRWGRKVSLILVLSGMGAATLLVGCLPSYALAGIAAPIMLIVLRVLQGLAAGGEFGVSSTSLVELAPTGHRGLFGSIAYATVFFGNLLGGALTLLLTTRLSPEALQAWGWRIPFLLSIVLLAVALYLRTRMTETSEFVVARQAHKLARIPLARAIRRYWRQMILIIGITAGLSAVNYALLSFMQTYLSHFLGYSLSSATAIVLISTALFGGMVLVFGRLSDVVGRKPVLVGAFISGIVLSLPGFLLLQSGSFPLAIVGMLVIGLADVAVCGALPAAFAEMFSPAERVSGFGVPYNVSSAIFGGLAPVLMTLLIQLTHNNLAPVLYVAAVCAFSLVFALFLRETFKRPLVQEVD